MAKAPEKETAPQQQQMSQIPDLTEIPVSNENTSLNLMVGFLNIAHLCAMPRSISCSSNSISSWSLARIL